MNTTFEKNIGKDEWLTPPSLLKQLGEFDLDPCASSRQPWKTAKKHYTKKDDGLKKPWHGRVWCNPPYGKETAKWMEKMKDHGNGIALIFNRSDTKNFHDNIWNNADAVYMIKGRLAFHYPDGSKGDVAGAPSILIAYGKNNTEVLKNLSIPGKFIPLHSGLSGVNTTSVNKSNSYYRARVALIQLYLNKLPVERGEINSPRELLKQGYIDPSLYLPGSSEYRLPNASSEQELIENFRKSAPDKFSDEPLTFTELTSFNTWFAMHPEKIAGIEEVTTSVHFPLTIKGNRDDVRSVLTAGLEKQKKQEPEAMTDHSMIDLINKFYFTFVGIGVYNLAEEKILYKTVVFKRDRSEVQKIVKNYMAKHFPDIVEGENLPSGTTKPYWIASIGLQPETDLDNVREAFKNKSVIPDYEPSVALPKVNYWYKIREQTGDRFEEVRKKRKSPDKAKKILIAKAKAKAIKIKLRLLNFDEEMKTTNYANSGLSGLGFISGLGALPKDTYSFLDDTSLGRIIAKDKEKKKAQGKLSFEEVIKKYNVGISDDEIKAWVWYKRSLGVPMAAWKRYYLDDSKAGSIDKVATAKKPCTLLDNKWEKVSQVPEGTVIGKPTKWSHEYKGENYIVITGTDGNKYIVLEDDVNVKESGQRVAEDKLDALVKKGVLFYSNGQYMPYPIFAFGNMYDRELEVKNDQETIISKFGQDIYEKHLKIVNERKPPVISIQNPDPNERPKINTFSDFAKNFYITELAEESGIELPHVNREEGEPEGHSLKEAFYFFLASLSREDFGVLSARQIWYYYVEGRKMSGMTDEEKATINQYAPVEGEALFARFLHEAISEEDKQKIDGSWNRTFNGFADVPYSRIPVGFECSNSFMQSDSLEFTPPQREAISFMQASGSGIVAYDVGVGKTISAIITVANALYEGKTKRPLIVVPDPTYDKWKKDIFGFTDKDSGEFFPGVLSFTDIKLNDWHNLGVDVLKRKDVNLDRPVPENSITIITYHGFMQLGYSKGLMNELFDEFYDILRQKEDASKTERGKNKKIQNIHEIVGSGNKGTIADFDGLGFDFMVIDEAHNMKNVFEDSPTDEEGVKRYNLTGSQSSRGIKAFFMCNYIQRKYGRNVMLLTATPFTNSPLEIYSMLSLVAYDKLVAMGIKNLQTFMETFIMQDLEYTNSYDESIKLKYVVKRFNNRLILQKLIHNHITYKTGEDAGVKRPCKINLPRLYGKRPSGDTYRLPPNEQILTYLEMSEMQEQNQAEIVSLAQDKSKLGNIFKAMGFSLGNAVSPYFYKYNEPPRDYKEFVDNSPKIKYTLECCKSVKQYHNERKEKVSGQVIYCNRGKEFFPMMKKYLEEQGSFGKNVKYNRRRFDEVEIITGGMSADRKEAIKDAFQDNVVKIIIGTSTITEGIDLQKHGTVLYILLPDWNPTSIRQVEGRIHRQKNRFGYVRIVMPLVQDSMDVFVFQKLEEKSARINDIWYRSDRGNVLDQESLDPEEVKFALFTNVDALTAIEVDKEKQDAQRRYSVAKSNYELIGKLKLTIAKYYEYQKKLRTVVSDAILHQKTYFDSGFNYENQRWWLNLTDANKKKFLERAEDVVKDMESFNESSAQDDKELLRSLKRLLKLYEDSSQDTEAYRLRKDMSEFKNYLSQVRKAERTTLSQRGYTIDDDLQPVLEEIQKEIEDIEKEAKVLISPEYFEKRRKEVVAKKEKLAIRAGTIQDRVEEFSKLNYLMQFSAGEVENNGYCLLPNKDGYVPNQKKEKEKQKVLVERILEQEREMNDEERKRKVLIAKAKAKAIRIKLKLLELDLQAA